MRIGRTVILVAAVGLLTSCLVFNPNVPSVACSDTSCSVNVAITVQTSPFKCDVDVNPQVLDVSGGLSPKTITWTFAVTVDGKSYSLPPSLPQLPIQFDSSANDVINGLALSGNTVSGTYYRPSKGGNHYGYIVSLPVAAAAAAVCKLDPWVVD